MYFDTYKSNECVVEWYAVPSENISALLRSSKFKIPITHKLIILNWIFMYRDNQKNILLTKMELKLCTYAINQKSKT